MKKMRTLMLGAAAGAAAAYFGDPQNGPERREKLRDKVSGGMRRAEDSFEAVATDAENGGVKAKIDEAKQGLGLPASSKKADAVRDETASTAQAPSVAAASRS